MNRTGEPVCDRDRTAGIGHIREMNRFHQSQNVELIPEAAGASNEPSSYLRIVPWADCLILDFEA